MSVYYEWVIEWIEPVWGDVIDLDHRDTYAEALAVAVACPIKEDEEFIQIGLVRNDDHGRTWAYISEGVLPEYFEDAYGERRTNVPKRYLKEVN